MLKRQACKITVNSSEGSKVYHDTFAAENALLDIPYDVEVLVEDIAEVPSYIFSGKPNIVAITFGNGVSSISTGACAGCRDLRSITFGKSMLRIRDYAFSRCYSLESLDCGESIRTIEKGAFFGCRRLRSILFNRGLVYVGPMAFAYCQSLSSVVCNFDMQCKISTNAFHQSLSQYAVRADIAKSISTDSAPRELVDGNEYLSACRFHEKVSNRFHTTEKRRLEKITKKIF